MNTSLEILKTQFQADCITVSNGIKSENHSPEQKQQLAFAITRVAIEVFFGLSALRCLLSGGVGGIIETAFLITLGHDFTHMFINEERLRTNGFKQFKTIVNVGLGAIAGAFSNDNPAKGLVRGGANGLAEQRAEHTILKNLLWVPVIGWAEEQKFLRNL